MGIYKTGVWSEGSIYERTLPEGYTELEYIESTGTQYIDTNVILSNNNFEIKVDFEFTEYTSQEQAITSIWTSTYGYWNLFLANDKKISLYLQGHNKINQEIQINKKYNIDVKRVSNDWIFSLDNTSLTKSYTPSSINETTLKIFTRGDTPSTSYSNSHLKIYSFKVYNNNILIRNMIPTQRNSDSVLGMYDIVNNVFYTNSGTGTFIAGPIVETSSAKVQIFKQKLPDAANIITEPDGSKWVQLFHHNNPTGGLFSSTDIFATGIYKDTNKWFNMNLCNKFNKWEILFKQKTTSDGTEEKYRWIQTVNPMIATFDQTKAADVTFVTTEGYTTPGSSYGGLWYKNASTYLSANNSYNTNWFGAVGSWTAWNGGTPGYDGKVVSSGYMDVYLRIDNDSITDDALNRLLIKNEYIEANNFIEM